MIGLSLLPRVREKPSLTNSTSSSDEDVDRDGVEKFDVDRGGVEKSDA